MKVTFNKSSIFYAILFLSLAAFTFTGYIQTVIMFTDSFNEIFFAVAALTIGILSLIGSINIKKN